jgi:hypothetical protein
MTYTLCGDESSAQSLYDSHHMKFNDMGQIEYKYRCDG